MQLKTCPAADMINEQSFRIAPSIVSAPLTNLGQLLPDLEQAGVEVLHIDIEDGHFMPGIMNLGTRLIAEMRPFSQLVFDVHLMVEQPEVFIPQVIEAGADMVSIHLEACPYPRRSLRMIQQAGAQAGLAYNPITPIEELGYLSPLLDYVNILTTEPELPDWPFLPSVLDKVRALSSWAQENHPDLLIEVDGGINSDRIGPALLAGARLIVAGRSVFADGGIEANVRNLKTAGEAHLANQTG